MSKGLPFGDGRYPPATVSERSEHLLVASAILKPKIMFQNSPREGAAYVATSDADYERNGKPTFNDNGFMIRRGHDSLVHQCK